MERSRKQGTRKKGARKQRPLSYQAFGSACLRSSRGRQSKLKDAVSHCAREVFEDRGITNADQQAALVMRDGDSISYEFRKEIKVARPAPIQTTFAVRWCWNLELHDAVMAGLPALTVAGTGIRSGIDLPPDALEALEEADDVFFIASDPIAQAVIEQVRHDAISLASYYGRDLPRLETTHASSTVFWTRCALAERCVSRCRVIPEC